MQLAQWHSLHAPGSSCLTTNEFKYFPYSFKEQGFHLEYDHIFDFYIYLFWPKWRNVNTCFTSFKNTCKNWNDWKDLMGLNRFVRLGQFGQSGQHTGDLFRNGRRSWQVVAFGLESVLVGNPSQRDFLSFRRNVVSRSLVGVARRRLLVISGRQLLLNLRFLASSSVRSSETGSF